MYSYNINLFKLFFNFKNESVCLHTKPKYKIDTKNRLLPIRAKQEKQYMKLQCSEFLSSNTSFF